MLLLLVVLFIVHHRLHKTQPKIDTVKKIVQGIPDALSFKDTDDQLPIQSAAGEYDSSIKYYVPILAKQGIKHKTLVAEECAVAC